MNSQVPASTGDAPEKPKSPLEQLKESTSNFPSDAKIQSWKAQAPGGRVKIFSPDGSRVFILRGFSGLELSTWQTRVMKNATDPDREVQLMAVAACTLFCSFGSLDEETLRTGPAGLPESLFSLIQNLSDFYDPVSLFNYSMEL